MRYSTPRCAASKLSLLAFLLLGSIPAFAAPPDYTMLPPTVYGSKSGCGSTTSILTYNGYAVQNGSPLATGSSAINCLTNGPTLDPATGDIIVNENWYPDQALEINSNQIWKSVTSGDSTLYFQYSAPGGPVQIGAPGGGNNLLVNGDINTSGTLTINGTGIAGNSCSPNGTLSNDGSGKILDCVNGVWQVFGKPTLTQTETVRLEQYRISGSEATQTSNQVHDLCTLSGVSAYSGQFWGQCIISGNPGQKWTIDVADYKADITCWMSCYDFQ